MDINLLKQHLSQVHGRLSINNSKDGYGNHNICEQHEELQHEEVSLTNSFIENYFGDSLSEDTTEDEILEAVTELNYTCYQVNEFFNGDRDESEEIDEDAVTDYFESYFGINLNEHIVEDDDIVEAINNLNALCEDVNETFGIDEGLASSIGKGLVYGGLAALAGTGAYHAGKKWLKNRAQRKADAKDAGRYRTIQGKNPEKVNKYVDNASKPKTDSEQRNKENASGAYTPPTKAETSKFK